MLQREKMMTLWLLRRPIRGNLMRLVGESIRGRKLSYKDNWLRRDFLFFQLTLPHTLIQFLRRFLFVFPGGGKVENCPPPSQRMTLNCVRATLTKQKGIESQQVFPLYKLIRNLLLPAQLGKNCEINQRNVRYSFRFVLFFARTSTCISCVVHFPLFVQLNWAQASVHFNPRSDIYL